MTPSASIVLTTYATPGPLLAISIDSVLHQTRTDLELVLVVDGDLAPEAEAVIADRVAADPRVVVLRPGRVGRARALNAGLAAATAPLVGILDADDASHPCRLEVQIALLDADPDLALVGTGWRVETSLTATADWDLAPALGGRTPAEHTHPVGRALLRSNPIVHSSVLARASVLRDAGGYDDTRTAQFDYDLLLRLWASGATMAVCDLPLVMHRRHPTQYFEGLGPGRRAWGSFRLQLSYTSQLQGFSRVSYSGVAAARLAYQVGRGIVWHWTSRRRLQATAS